MLNVRYIGPHDAVEVDGVGVVAHGETVAVSTEVAGRKPAARVDKAHNELAAATAAHDHPLAAQLREEIIGLETGSGLLAQAGNWEAVTAAKTDTKTDTKAEVPE